MFENKFRKSYILMKVLCLYQKTKIYFTANQKKISLLDIIESDANTVKT